MDGGLAAGGKPAGNVIQGKMKVKTEDKLWLMMNNSAVRCDEMFVDARKPEAEPAGGYQTLCC